MTITSPNCRMEGYRRLSSVERSLYRCRVGCAGTARRETESENETGEYHIRSLSVRVFLSCPFHPAKNPNTVRCIVVRAEEVGLYGGEVDP